MGLVAADLADRIILTSDNPRSEDPAAIADEIVDGLDLDVELDRRRAIRLAARLARTGDAVLVTGKGHETTHEVAGRKHPFDDRVELAAALRRNGARGRVVRPLRSRR